MSDNNIDDLKSVDWCSSPLKLKAKDDGDFTWYRIWETEIPGILVWDRRLYPDNRGFFQELSRVEPLSDVLDRDIIFKQLSLSYNEPKGVLRGLHAEPMDKAISLLTGKVFIALVDIRADSPTFGKWVTFTLDSSDHRKQRMTIFIPNGVANSFLTVGDEEVMYLYQTTQGYKTSEGKRSIKWDDPDLDIPWPITPTIISEADTKNPSLRELFPGRFNDK